MQLNGQRQTPRTERVILALVASLCCVEQAAATRTVSLGEPTEPGIAGHLAVPNATNINVPKGVFTLVLWQVNPHQSNGLLVPTTWNAGSQTGFTPTSPATAQLGFRNQAGSSTAQMEGATVGAYLNSADLGTSTGGQKMMITPEYQFVAGAEPEPFASSNGAVQFGLDMQIPVAGGSQAYAAVDFEFIDPNGIRISYGIKLFHNGGTSFVAETGYDAPSRSYQVREPLGWDSRLATAAPGSASETGTPWLGWRHFQWTIGEAQFVAALNYLATHNPTVAISTDPTHYLLTKVHLNAEIHFTTTPTELGWSMRNASISFTE